MAGSPHYPRPPALLSPQIHCRCDTAPSGLKTDPAIHENWRHLLCYFPEISLKVREGHGGIKGRMKLLAEHSAETFSSRPRNWGLPSCSWDLAAGASLETQSKHLSHHLHFPSIA